MKFNFPIGNGYVEGFDDGSVYVKIGTDEDASTAFRRNQAEELHSWLGEFLEETTPALPADEYAVIDAKVDYGSGLFGHRLVLVAGTWLDRNGNDHSVEAIKSFEIVREGLTD